MLKEEPESFTSADEIVVYSHSHGWTLEETQQSLQSHGFMVSAVAIIETWTHLDEIDRCWESLQNRA